MATYLKAQGEHENTLLLDQGDTWQGSIYSNFNHGGLLTDIFNYVHYDARTIGNHDFDWGVEALETNSAKSYDGYRVPVLAANVYDYNFTTKEFGDTQQSNIGQSSVTYTLENGLKVGVVGVIGKSQITSINSLFTHDIGFKDHIVTLKTEANLLRAEGCDIVIASCHTGQEEVMNNNLGDYVDLVLCAHTHKFEYGQEGDLHFAQFGANDKGLGKVTLTFDYSTNKVVSTNIQEIRKSTVANSVVTIDPVVTNLITTYSSECDSEANVVVANNVTGTFGEKAEAPNLMCKAIYDQAISEGHDIVLSYVNNARSNLSGTSWTYADLYSAFPFDNTVYIMDVSGYDLINECYSYNWIYRNPNFNEPFDSNATYRIAVLDYLGFHTNDNREYNYFPSVNGQYVSYLSKNYRVILRDWLMAHDYDKGVELRASDYSSNGWNYNRRGIQTAVQFYDGDDLINTIGGTQGEYVSNIAAVYTPTKSGYSFVKWTKDKAGNTAIGANDKVGKNTIKLYANYVADGSNVEVVGFVNGDAYNFGSERITINVNETKAIGIMSYGSRLTPNGITYDDEFLASRQTNGYYLFGGLSTGSTTINFTYDGEDYVFNVDVVNNEAYTTLEQCRAKCVADWSATRADATGAFFSDKVSFLVDRISFDRNNRTQIYAFDAFTDTSFYIYYAAEFTWAFDGERWSYTQVNDYASVNKTIAADYMVTVNRGACYSYNTTLELCYSTIVSSVQLPA